MPVQMSGMASGLDTASIIKQLMQIESIPLMNIQSQQQVLKWRKEMLNDFKVKLSDLQTKASAMTLSSAFTVKTVNSSDESILTATASSSAANGTYNINATTATATSYVSTASVMFSAGTAATLSSSAEMNTTLGIDVNPNAKFNDPVNFPAFEAPYDVSGGVHAGQFYINNIKIDVAADDTINTVINKINSNSLTGVKASLSGDKITLTQNNIGSTPTISITGDTSGFVAATKLGGAVVAGTNSGYVSKLNTTGLGFNSGTFTINGYTFSVDAANESAQDIVNKINSATAAGVTAFYDTNTNKLTITNRNTGAKDIAWGSAYDTSNFLATMNIDTTGASGKTMGKDAVISINGATITRSSNTFDYNGVTFNLKKDGAVNVTVNQDVDSIISSIKDFVTSYNSVIDYINDKLGEKTVKDPVTDADRKMGILNSDYMLKSTLDTLRRNIMDPVSGLPINMNQMAMIGISTGDSSSGKPTGLDSKLVIDETKLKNALSSDPSSVQSLFQKGSGVITNEVLAGVDGVNTTFSLANKNLSSTLVPSITDDVGTVYTYTTGVPAGNQFSVNFTNGTVTFGAAPAAGRTLKASYNYYATGGGDAGIAIRIKSQVEALTSFNGMLDSRIGSSGSLTKEISDMDDTIKNMQDMLSMREDNLNRQFAAMETALSSLKNQGSWLSGQIASLPSSM